MKSASIAFISVLVFGTSTVAIAQEIPRERVFVDSWQKAGCPEILSPDLVVNLRDFGAKGDGKADDQPAIESAIKSLGPGGGVVFIPQGTYLFQKPIRLASGVILRGEGPEKTHLLFDFVAHAILASANPKDSFQKVPESLAAHDTTIPVTNGSDFAPGDYFELHQDNDPEWKTSSWARKIGAQIGRVRQVDGNTLQIEVPLRLDFPAKRNPMIRKIEPVTDVGIENLKVERRLAGDEGSRNNKFTIGFRYAARGWVRGVEGVNAFGGHVGAQSSTQLTVSGCYFHHAHEYDGGGSGYGVRLEMKTGDCLVEDNIFQSLRHSMLVQAGANGNVFGYNYSIEPRRTEPPSEISSDICIHGNYPFANLFEGNICQHIWLDYSHGANGPLNTFLRNRALRYGINITNPLSKRQNFLGNETFTGRWAIFLGDGYNLRGEGHYEQANLSEAKGLQPPGSDLSTRSLYFAGEKPTFWSAGLPFPTIGPPYKEGREPTIPAKDRFLEDKKKTVYP